MHKRLKIRLYPNQKQKEVLDNHFNAYRFLYNLSLEYKIMMYKDYGINKSGYDLSGEILKLRKETDWLLEYKANWYGREIIKIDTYFPSSKMCSSCGNIKQDLQLSDRVYKCGNCNLEIDRDYNATLNIKNSGIKSPSEPVESKVTNSVNQELLTIKNKDLKIEEMVEIVNSNGLDVDFHHNGSEYVIDYKTTQKGSEKKVDFKVVDEELIRTAVTCGCTSVEDVTKNSFSINYKKDRTGSINQVVTLTFKSGDTAKIRLSGYVTT